MTHNTAIAHQFVMQVRQEAGSAYAVPQRPHVLHPVVPLCGSPASLPLLLVWVTPSQHRLQESKLQDTKSASSYKRSTSRKKDKTLHHYHHIILITRTSNTSQAGQKSAIPSSQSSNPKIENLWKTCEDTFNTMIAWSVLSSKHDGMNYKASHKRQGVMKVDGFTGCSLQQQQHQYVFLWWKQTLTYRNCSHCCCHSRKPCFANAFSLSRSAGITTKSRQMNELEQHFANEESMVLCNQQA